jgi:hypothetical protein
VSLGRAGVAGAIGLVVAMIAALLVVVARSARGDAQCGPGFRSSGARCVGCPAPLVATAGGCDAPDLRVLVPATTLEIGPSDWEAEGRILPRTIKTRAFRIAAFEATIGSGADGARARAGMTRDEAAAYCAARGGRLPTEDEWIVAATAGQSIRYRVAGEPAHARGGSWQSELATDLRTWARLELPEAARDPRVGVRCAFDAE